MKKEIRIKFEFQCYPIWIYDEKGDFIDNDLVDEIKNDKIIVKELNYLQEIFDSLYFNDTQTFEYVGFSSLEKEKNFLIRTNQLYEELCEKLSDNYIVKNMM